MDDINNIYNDVIIFEREDKSTGKKTTYRIPRRNIFLVKVENNRERFYLNLFLSNQQHLIFEYDNETKLNEFLQKNKL